MSDWERIADREAGDSGTGTAGTEYRVLVLRLDRREDENSDAVRWRIRATEDWGNNQVHRESHGTREAEGRGATPAEAVAALRQDVLAWGTQYDVYRRAEYAIALRQIVYDAEDAGYPS